MPPLDGTSNVLKKPSFELLYSLKAYNKIPVYEYKSTKTGLTVVIAEVDGPVVNGYFCVVTEAFDDDGLPHTLEHLIFLGSEDYPYKGVLDLLANRCLASGTNAWTDVDHTCYTMETAGSEGFLELMPIYLDHILYPILSEEGFVTEVHHITPEGDDAGVVYCEMQGIENSGELLLHVNMMRSIYPGKCGYSSETGGVMKNLRESTCNEKIKKYHKEFYRPENLKLVITGQVKPEQVFAALEKLEKKILSKGPLEPFQRPWQSPVPPLTESKDLKIKYPTDDESNGIYSMAWRGPSSVKDQYNLTAVSLLLKYLTDLSVSPLQKEFVEVDDPFASSVSYNLAENSISCLYVMFHDVPTEKLSFLKEKLLSLLKNIAENENIDMERMKSIINRHKLESLSSVESSPHKTVAFMIIGHMLYGNSKEDLEQRVNPLTDISKLIKEPKSFWVFLLKKYLVENVNVSIECTPSKEEQIRIEKAEKDRVDAQIKKLTEEGLKNKKQLLEDSIKYNEREPPAEMLSSVDIPAIDSIKFHKITRFSSKKAEPQLDLTKSPVFTYFDHVESNFVHIYALLDTSNIPSELRVYLPLLLETIVESSVSKDGRIIPYEEVVAELTKDTVSVFAHIGQRFVGRFSCGVFSQTALVSMQVEASKYKTGLGWLKDLLYNTVFTVERLKVIASKRNNAVAQAKRGGREVANFLMTRLNYVKDSNKFQNGMMHQNAFLTETIKALDSDKALQIVENVEKLRNIITNPDNFVLYLAGNLEILPDVTGPLQNILPDSLKTSQIKGLNATPDYKLLTPNEEGSDSGCIVGLGCLESSFFRQCIRSITNPHDPDLPALILYLQYLTQAEGPMWKQIRGKGYSYGYAMRIDFIEGLLYLMYTRATNIEGAYKETKEIIIKQIESKEWDQNLIEAAKSSLVFEIIDEEKTIVHAVGLSLLSHFSGTDYEFNRTLLTKINKVTVEDLNRVGAKYVAPLFDPKKVKTAIATVPSKIKEMSDFFKDNGLELKVYSSLEDTCAD